jgi:hypothetical protein
MISVTLATLGFAIFITSLNEMNLFLSLGFYTRNPAECQWESMKASKNVRRGEMILWNLVWKVGPLPGGVVAPLTVLDGVSNVGFNGKRAFLRGSF